MEMNSWKVPTDHNKSLNVEKTFRERKRSESTQKRGRSLGTRERGQKWLMMLMMVNVRMLARAFPEQTHKAADSGIKFCVWNATRWMGVNV